MKSKVDTNGNLQEADFLWYYHRANAANKNTMFAFKDGRARGFWCTIIEICEADVDGLVHRGFLDRMARNDPAAVERAIATVLEQL